MFEVEKYRGAFKGDSRITAHWSTERKIRAYLVEVLIEQEHAVIFGAYRVDKGHKNGAEIHVLYSNGIIRIYNERTRKHITDLVGRIGQCKRYVRGRLPRKMYEAAKEHERLNFNNW